jgi:hypothetical protein
VELKQQDFRIWWNNNSKTAATEEYDGTTWLNTTSMTTARIN